MQNSKVLPELAPSDICTGCGACANACSRNAISMQWNVDGFLSPVVDADACVHCGMCSRSCPALDSENRFTHIPLTEARVFAGWHKEPMKRHASSSGGIFTALAEVIIKKGGIVFGVEQRDDLSAGFASIDTIEELARLRGSKYTQAETGYIYREVRAFLNAGKVVLFSGTPCQVAGLLAYLRKPHPNLVTCEVACHGVPTRYLYTSYLKLNQTMAGSPITGVKFREKTPNWQNFSVNVEYASASSTEAMHRNDYYMRGFLSDCVLNQACYTCRCSSPRRADITLADYWGVSKAHPDWNVDDGVSIMYANSQAGLALVDECKGALELIEETPENHDIARKHNGGLRNRIMHYPLRRERIINDLKQETLPVVIKKHLCGSGTQVRKDVAIMGMWMTCNYGAVYTTHALYRVIESMGLDPVLLDISASMNARYRDENTLFRRYIAAEKLQKSPSMSLEQLAEWNDRADTFLVGSDQVWRYEYRREGVLAFFLNFVQGGKRRIAYGSSFGIETAEYPTAVMSEAAACLQCFDAVSSREHSGVNTLRNQFNIESTFVLDPVFLLSAEKWSKSAARAERKPEGQFVLSYILDPTPDKRAMLLHVQEREGLPLINMVDAQFDFEGKKAALGLPGVVEDLTLEEWLYNVEHCSHFVTDSFHGVCFALIFNKPFTCIANVKRGYPRFPSLLELTEQMGRMVQEHAKPEELDCLPPTNWQKVNEILDLERDRSRKWLQDALFGERAPWHQQAGALLHHINQRTEILKKELSKVVGEGTKTTPDTAVEKLCQFRFEITHTSKNNHCFEIRGTDGMRISSPAWLCRSGYGKMLVGSTGSYTLQVTIHESGRLGLTFRGVDIRGKSGRIPVWVDITRLLIDSNNYGAHEVWHDKGFTLKLDVTAGQVITIDLTTQPHLHSDGELQQLLDALYPESGLSVPERVELLSEIQNRVAGMRGVSLISLFQGMAKKHAQVDALNAQCSSTQQECKEFCNTLSSVEKYISEQRKMIAEQGSELIALREKFHATETELLTTQRERASLLVKQSEAERTLAAVKCELMKQDAQAKENSRVLAEAQEKLKKVLRCQQLNALMPRLWWQYQLLRVIKTFSFGKKRQHAKNELKKVRTLIHEFRKTVRNSNPEIEI